LYDISCLSARELAPTRGIATPHIGGVTQPAVAHPAVAHPVLEAVVRSIAESNR
jgi:phosphoglycerate dehydrogenase-like enzyme